MLRLYLHVFITNRSKGAAHSGKRETVGNVKRVLSKLKSLCESLSVGLNEHFKEQQGREICFAKNKLKRIHLIRMK